MGKFYGMYKKTSLKLFLKWSTAFKFVKENYFQHKTQLNYHLSLFSNMQGVTVFVSYVPFPHKTDQKKKKGYRKQEINKGKKRQKFSREIVTCDSKRTAVYQMRRAHSRRPEQCELRTKMDEDRH